MPRFQLPGELVLPALALALLLVGRTPTRAQDEPPGEEAVGQQQFEAQYRETLPKLEELSLPKAEQLLRDDPRDWIILHDDSVIVCEPVYPRPDTLKKLAVLRDTGTAEEKIAAKSIDLFIPGGENPEYKIDVRLVKEVRTHEDLMLLRVDRLIESGSLRSAFEILQNVEARVKEEWPPTEQRRRNLLFRESEIELEAGDRDRALILMNELYETDSEYPGLSEQFGRVIDRIAGEMVEVEDFRGARHYVERLKGVYPEHEVIAKWNDDFLKRANTELASAQTAADSGNHSDAATAARQAVRIWPATQSKARGFLRRFQTLRVGVLELAGGETGYPLMTDADHRHATLTETPLFEPTSGGNSVQFTSSWFREWEPTDLGRRVTFQLVRDRPYWQSQKVVTASSLADAFARRLNPAHVEFDERLRSFVQSYRVISPFEFQLEFRRVPMRIEPLLQFPLRPSDDDVTNSDNASHRFAVHEQGLTQTIYRRSIPEPDNAPTFHIAEVIEKQFTTDEKAMQALVRGEVDMLPTIRPWLIDEVRKSRRFSAYPYSVPTTHSIQFNPNSESLRNRQLRIALSYSVDRDRILQNKILKGSSYGRLVNAPFSSRSYANNPLVPVEETDVTAGYALVLSAKKSMDDKLPALKMVCPPDAVARSAAEAIVELWGRMGLDVTLLPVGAVDEDWDLLYRASRMLEPLTDLWPFLAIDDRARVSSLTHLPDWLAQELIDLEQLTGYQAVTDHLHELHRHLALEGHFIPLWEVDDHYVVTSKVIVNPREPVVTYQGVESWLLRP